MKKIFCAVLALAAMASCSNEYTIDYNKQAIAFGDTFVNNGTRADYSDGTNQVDEFKVWGTVKGKFTGAEEVYIFDGATVERPDGLTGYNPATAWIYTGTQYWVPNTNYAFTAIVDGEFAKDGGNYDYTKIPFTVTNGDGDLLYATATASVANDGTPETLNPENTAGYVAFQFDHLLSKVQFTVQNAMATDYSIQVTSIKVSDVAKDGIYTKDNNGDWSWQKNGSAVISTPLDFGTTEEISSTGSAVASATHQILPVEQTLNVTIGYDIYFGTTKIAEATKSGSIAQTFAKGLVYNVVATITNGDQIDFTVISVKVWASGGNLNVQ